MSSVCQHPKEARHLEHGYDVVCSACQQIVGRVAMFPCAVVSAREARSLLQVIDCSPEPFSYVTRRAYRTLTAASDRLPEGVA